MATSSATATSSPSASPLAPVASALAPQCGRLASFDQGALSIFFAPEGSARLGSPAGVKMATNPLLGQSNGCKDSDGKAAPSSSGEPEAGFTASLLCKWEMAGTDCRLKRRLCRKGSQHGKLSSFRPVDQLLHAGSEHHAAAAAVGGFPLIFGEPTRSHNGQQLARAVARSSAASPQRKQKARSRDRAFVFNPSNPFRRLRPPRPRRHRRPRHQPRRLRRQPRSLPPWRRGAGSWRAGSRFP
jgi:hypothetical protein